MSTRVIVLALLVVSAAANTIGIVKWNAGAPYDTAHKGIETIEEVLQGNLKPFYRHYNGQPPFMDWLLAGVFLLFGASPYTLHAIGVASGILSTLLWYLTGKILWSTRAGLYASAFGTTSHWFLLETREGTHNIPLVPILLCIIFCTAYIIRTPKNGPRFAAATLGGIAIGSLGYIYAAGWIFIIICAIAFPTLALTTFIQQPRSSLPLATIYMTAIAGVLLIPFIAHILHDPQSVVIHADDEIRTRHPQQIIIRVVRNLAPMTGAFTYLIFPPFSNWENNASLTLAGIPIGFPVPFVSPIGAALLLTSLGIILWGWYQKKLMIVPTLLVGLLVIAVIPNLLTTGPQPHYRRAVCAMVPLFLLMGYAAAHLHERASSIGKKGLHILTAASLVYGLVMYFVVGIHSQWFAETYQTNHDRIAPLLFAHINQGDRVTLAGNTAHMKSFQFYALATPRDRHAFRLLNLHTAEPFPEEVLITTDVLVYVHPSCAQIAVPQITLSPTIIRSRFGIDACIFKAPHVSSPAKVSLPASKPLLAPYLNSQTPLDVHQPFQGPIYGS